MILASAFAISVSAQAPQAATPPLPRNDVDDMQKSQVVLGLDVELKDERGGTVKGTLARVDFDGPDVVVRTKGGDVAVPKSSLQRVEKHRVGKSTGYGALSGLGAGVAVLKFFYSTGDNPSYSTLQGELAFVGLTTAIGTAIGLAHDLAHHRSKHTIFVAPMPGAAKVVPSPAGTPMLARDNGVRVGYRMTF